MKYALVVGGKVIRFNLGKSKAYELFNLLCEVIKDGRDISVITTLHKEGDVHE